MSHFRGGVLPLAFALLLLLAAHVVLGGVPVMGPVNGPVLAQTTADLPVPPKRADTAPSLAPTLPATASAPGARVTNELTATTGLTATGDLTVTSTPTYYVVLPGDTLYVIATDFGATVDAVMTANGLVNSDLLYVGQVLLIPGPNGELPDPALVPLVGGSEVPTGTVIVPRGTITERMTVFARQIDRASPYYGTTWLTYYGRPNIPVMGILGEFDIAELTPRLRTEATAYDRANGDALTVTPAFHLVYGMATKAAGEDGSHLAFMDDTTVISYIEAAEVEDWNVILDVQVGALEPAASITRALKFLHYPNVHLAIDPEFAMAHPGQLWPGNPIGYVTAAQVNQVQAVVNAYLQILGLPGPRVLLVHQFQDTMIVDPAQLDTTNYPHVALTLSVDGWGGPWGKISKYNALVTPDSPFTAFKLFYRWDEPLMTPDEALGVRPYRGSDFFMDVTPNLIIYQ